MRAAIASACAAVALATTALAADATSVTASVQPQGRVSDTTTVRLIVRIEGDAAPEVVAPRLPTMKNLSVSGGPSTARSSSFTFANGRFANQHSLVLTYYLRPLGPGEAEIPAFDVKVGDSIYRTEPLRFQVEAGRSGPAPPSPRPGAPRDEAEEGAAGDVDVFLQARLGDTSVWAGQPVLLEITLFAGAPVSQFAWTDEPSLSGVWSDDLSVHPDRDNRRVALNGREYIAYPVARKVLVPTQPGRIAITPFTAQIQVRRSSRDPFGAFFSLGRSILIDRRTAPLALEVKALPESGRPDDFGGAVGSYRMTAELDRSSVDVGEAVALRVTVEGDGSLQAAAPPRVTAPPDVKLYEPKLLTSEATGVNHLSSRKSWEWVVVPLAPGRMQVPSPTMSVFDVRSGAFRTLRAEIPLVEVRRGATPLDSGVARGEVQPNRRDIAFLKPRRGALREPSPPLHRRGWFVALLGLPVVAVPLTILWGRRRERLLSDHGFARGRRAARSAARRLRKAEQGGIAAAAFHEEVARALVEYVADRSNRSAAGLTYDQLESLLAEKGVDADLRRRYRACLESCDFARFVPDATPPRARDAVVQEARAIVAALEGAS